MKGGDEPSNRGGSSEERLESLAQDFLRKHQRKLILIAIVLGLLVLIGIAMAFS